MPNCSPFSSTPARKAKTHCKSASASCAITNPCATSPASNPLILSKIKALGPAKTAKLIAAFELGRRAAQEPSHAEVILDRPQRIYDYIGSEMQALGYESVRVILLNTRLAVIRTDEVFRGSLNECTAAPRDLLRKALIHNAYAFILIHNHPFGDPTPSDADRRITRRLREASEATGLLLQDHLIIGTPSESRALPVLQLQGAWDAVSRLCRRAASRHRDRNPASRSRR
jgi:DNA repair protein RadC